jgi:hypothetical protein
MIALVRIVLEASYSGQTRNRYAEVAPGRYLPPAHQAISCKALRNMAYYGSNYRLACARVPAVLTYKQIKSGDQTRAGG